MWGDNNVVNKDPKGKRKGTFRKENNSILDMLDFV